MFNIHGGKMSECGSSLNDNTEPENTDVESTVSEDEFDNATDTEIDEH